MAGQTSTKLKEYFAQYAKPTAAQFAELIDTLYEKAASILPKADNSYNLGSTDKKFKDLHLSGNAAVGGTLTALTAVAGNVTNDKAEALNPEPTVSIDLSKSNVQKLTVDQDLQIRFVNLAIGRWAVILSQDAAGGHSVSFGSGVLATGSVGTNGGQVDLLDVVCDGVNCYVSVINDYK